MLGTKIGPARQGRIAAEEKRRIQSSQAQSKMIASYDDPSPLARLLGESYNTVPFPSNLA